MAKNASKKKKSAPATGKPSRPVSEPAKKVITTTVTINAASTPGKRSQDQD